MIQSHFQLFPCGSILIFICYFALSTGLAVYPRSGSPAAGLELFSRSDELPGLMQHLLPPAVISEVGNTGILQIHSQFSKRVVSSEKPLVKLPGYCQGTSGRSCVFRTMWPDKGAKEAPQVQSIAKAIYGQTYLDEEVNALKKVGQLVDVGYTSSNDLKIWWVIMKDLTAPPDNLAPLHVIIARQLKEGNKVLADVHLNSEGCRELFLVKALNLAKEEMKRLVEQYHLLHTDGGLLNILFNSELTRAEFIDWGDYSESDQWDENAEKAFQTTKDKLTFEATMRCNNFPAHFSSAITEC